jgi:hypothetical protein
MSPPFYSLEATLGTNGQESIIIVQGTELESHGQRIVDVVLTAMHTWCYSTPFTRLQHSSEGSFELLMIALLENA